MNEILGSVCQPKIVEYGRIGRLDLSSLYGGNNA